MHRNALAHTKHHPHKNAQHPAHSVEQGAAPSSGSRRALQTVPRTRHARCAARRRRRAASADQDTRMAQPLGDRRRLCQTETTSQPSGRAAPKRGQYRQVISTSTSTCPCLFPCPCPCHCHCRCPCRCYCPCYCHCPCPSHCPCPCPCYCHCHCPCPCHCHCPCHCP